MSKPWHFDQPLDEKTPSSSTEERAKIAALFNQKETPTTEDVDYASAFKKEQAKAIPNQASKDKSVTVPVNEQPSTITKDYKQHLVSLMEQNNEAIAQSQKKIEELHQLIDDKNKQNKKLQAISAAIDDL